MKADPRYTKEQVKILERVIRREKAANNIGAVESFTELLEKGGIDIDIKKLIAPPPSGTPNEG
ncbi:hypothetical protein [Treponema sp. R6D11]